MTDRRPIAALPTQWPCPHRLGPKICVPATSRAPHFWFLRYRTGVVEIVVDQNPVPMRRSICQRPAAGDKSTQAAPPDWIHAAPQIFQPNKVEWLWHGRMARGKHTCIGANPAPARACGSSREPDRQRSRQAGGYRPAPAEVNRMARQHGLTPKTARSARAALKVKITRDGLARAPSRYGFPPKGLHRCPRPA